ncbi:hypothetical protein CYMTET_48703 [Cymbomonas tetramitiformis]|uniref:ethanolamine kinase n=1 Tax=Cymbomonas tetramitiformis TaxID=36881 RepID=A0AAE0EWJ0_9CHLO|nr:hypothetical protein CYMTET_48703 [Cymbomonas tetramitiformis]
MSAPTLDCTINLNAHFHTLVSELRKLCKSALAGWSRLSEGSLEVRHVEGGITNVLFKVTPVAYVSDVPLPPVIVRIFGSGSDHFIDRNTELLTLRQLNCNSFGPQVVATFTNGRIEEFIGAEKGIKTLTSEDFAAERISGLIARRLRALHAVKVEGISQDDNLWTILQDYFHRVCRLTFSDASKQEQFDKMQISSLECELTQVEAACKAVNSPTVFCHNDLTPGNIMYDHQKDAGRQSCLHFIDFEYSCHNPRGFDIANHFNEFAGFANDWTLYPSEETQRQFFRQYLAGRASSSAPDGWFMDYEPSQSELEAILVEVNLYSLASHLFWCLWAVLQAKFSPIQFDFIAFSQARLGEYRRRKEDVMKMRERILKPSHVYGDID